MKYFFRTFVAALRAVVVAGFFGLLLQSCGGGHDETTAERVARPTWTVVLNASFADDESMPAEWVQVLNGLGFLVTGISTSESQPQVYLRAMHEGREPDLMSLRSLEWVAVVYSNEVGYSNSGAVAPIGGEKKPRN